MDFGEPPHSLIVPGRLTKNESRSLEKFAGVPRNVLEEEIEGYGAETPF